MPVPFNDLSRQTRSLGPALSAAIESVLASGRYVMGPQHDAFESEFADHCGVSHCLGVGNGTDALEIALRAVGCGQSDEVVTAANAGGYATTAAVLVGATPVFADVDPTTLLLTAETVEPLLSSKTKAIVVTHLFGTLAEMEPIIALAATHGVRVVEDCAQAHGAERTGERAGSFGDLATFSFYPTKNLGALGDGGAIVTNDDETAERVCMLRQYGWAARYDAREPLGRNSRLDELQAAILRVKLPHLDGWNARRRDIAERYRAAAHDSDLTLLPAGLDSVAHLCVGLHPNREGFRDQLAREGIETAIHYPTPDHRQPALARVTWRSAGLPVTESAADRIVSLPCFPELEDSEVDHVCAALEESA